MGYVMVFWRSAYGYDPVIMDIWRYRLHHDAGHGMTGISALS
jgi:hypothetical protein